jgi:exonuclease VII large subunit
MKVTEPEDTQRYTDLFNATIQQAVGGAGALMARLVAHVRGALRELEGAAQDRRERDRLTHSRRSLNQCEEALCTRFAEELRNAFNRMSSIERPAPAASLSLHFDQLAGMDAAQVHDHVEAARKHTAVQAAANPALDELNRLVCALLGLQEVHLERNPLRPTVYIDAVTAALAHLPVPLSARQAWMSLMLGALGHELDVYYHDLCADLRDKGVGSAAGLPARAGTSPPRADPGLLTLE